MSSLSNKRVGRYLLYAFGEIILVVAGILIALKINNYNEAAKEAKLLNGVLKNVSYDLELDTLTVNNAIAFYEAREKIAQEILSDAYTLEDYKSCVLCGSMLSTYFPLKINDKGYSQLKSFNEGSDQKDSLTVDIVQFYNAYSALLGEFGDQVKDFSIGNIKDWRDHQPWFASVTSGKADPRFYEYMTTQEFKNKVAYFNAIACKNYLNMLRQYKLNALELLRRLREREQNVS
jgi:hypothetical protein